MKIYSATCPSGHTQEYGGVEVSEEQIKTTTLVCYDCETSYPIWQMTMHLNNFDMQFSDWVATGVVFALFCIIMWFVVNS